MRWLRGKEGGTGGQVGGYLAMLETSEGPDCQLSVGCEQRDSGRLVSSGGQEEARIKGDGSHTSSATAQIAINSTLSFVSLEQEQKSTAVIS
jgi:hypothetical protein